MAKELPIAGQARYNGHGILELLINRLPDCLESGNIVKRVLELHADPGVKLEKGLTPLLHSVLKGKFEIVKPLLEFSDCYAKDLEDSNIYHMVAIQGSLEMFELVSSRGASYFAFERNTNRFGDTPGKLCRKLLEGGKISSFDLDKKMNYFFGSGAVF